MTESGCERECVCVRESGKERECLKECPAGRYKATLANGEWTAEKESVAI
jgi:hypothetical protein